jgi:hypothetical protein
VELEKDLWSERKICGVEGNIYDEFMVQKNELKHIQIAASAFMVISGWQTSSLRPYLPFNQYNIT